MSDKQSQLLEFVFITCRLNKVFNASKWEKIWEKFCDLQFQTEKCLSETKKEDSLQIIGVDVTNLLKIDTGVLKKDGL